MRISRGRARLRVSEQRADQRQGRARRCENAGKSMAQIMNAYVLDIGGLAKLNPGVFEMIPPGLARNPTRKNVITGRARPHRRQEF